MSEFITVNGQTCDLSNVPASVSPACYAQQELERLDRSISFIKELISDLEWDAYPTAEESAHLAKVQAERSAFVRRCRREGIAL